jgi:CheY-like chemotaxis protein
MSKPSNSPKKILLADDSVTMHRAVKLGLKKEPFDVICCDNGQDAWRLTQELMPDAILADLDMPGMTGSELCQKIKSNPAFAHIPVILVCGSFDQIDEKQLENIPADARLWKPFETHVLVSLLAKVLADDTHVKESAEATAAAPLMASRPPPPPPSSRLKEVTQSGFEPTISEHIGEPNVDDVMNADASLFAGANQTREVELPSVKNNSESLLEGFQDIPLNESDSGLHAAIEATELGLSPSAEPTTNLSSAENYENLWSSDNPSPNLSSEPTETKPIDDNWGSLDNSEKSFSNEVFEAVESRNFEDDSLEDMRSAEPTEVLGSSIKESSTDLQSFREETSQSLHSRPMPPKSVVTNPMGTSLVDHSSSAAATAIHQNPGLSDEDLRKIIREEIQTAIAGWLKNKLHDELDRVLEEIDRE